MKTHRAKINRTLKYPSFVPVSRRSYCLVKGWRWKPLHHTSVIDGQMAWTPKLSGADRVKWSPELDGTNRVVANVSLVSFIVYYLFIAPGTEISGSPKSGTEQYFFCILSKWNVLSLKSSSLYFTQCFMCARCCLRSSVLNLSTPPYTPPSVTHNQPSGTRMKHINVQTTDQCVQTEVGTALLMLCHQI